MPSAGGATVGAADAEVGKRAAARVSLGGGAQHAARRYSGAARTVRAARAHSNGPQRTLSWADLSTGPQATRRGAMQRAPGTTAASTEPRADRTMPHATFVPHESYSKNFSPNFVTEHPAGPPAEAPARQGAADGAAHSAAVHGAEQAASERRIASVLGLSPDTLAHLTVAHAHSAGPVQQHLCNCNSNKLAHSVQWQQQPTSECACDAAHVQSSRSAFDEPLGTLACPAAAHAHSTGPVQQPACNPSNFRRAPNVQWQQQTICERTTDTARAQLSRSALDDSLQLPAAFDVTLPVHSAGLVLSAGPGAVGGHTESEPGVSVAEACLARVHALCQVIDSCIELARSNGIAGTSPEPAALHAKINAAEGTRSAAATHCTDNGSCSWSAGGSTAVRSPTSRSPADTRNNPGGGTLRQATAVPRHVALQISGVRASASASAVTRARSRAARAHLCGGQPTRGSRISGSATTTSRPPPPPPLASQSTRSTHPPLWALTQREPPARGTYAPPSPPSDAGVMRCNALDQGACPGQIWFPAGDLQSSMGACADALRWLDCFDCRLGCQLIHPRADEACYSLDCHGM